MESTALPRRRRQVIQTFAPSSNKVARHEYERVLIRALVQFLPPDTSAATARAILASFTDLAALSRILRVALDGAGVGTFVTGSVDERLFVFFATARRWLLCSLGRPVSELPLPVTQRDALRFSDEHAHVCWIEVPDGFETRLTRPHVKLVSLYHPENFPLPRFALGISDLARAVRRQMMGSVTLLDMQLGCTIEEILEEVARDRPEIIGISATFGQHDILDRILRALRTLTDYAPMIVVGGSLATLNSLQIIQDFPNVIVAKGAGEKTMQDIVRVWHGDIPLGSVTGVEYASADRRVVRTQGLAPDQFRDMLPELDLLGPTLERKGVMQLESSRGCSYACSFCPREHKGIWVGDAPEGFTELLPFVAPLYEQNRAISRKIFLVDEEFFGYQPTRSEQRVIGVCKELHAHGFRFETSSRIDQVYRPHKDREWHLERMRVWRFLIEHGLSRCLFGVESGVTSILERFNKKVTGEQNVLALRILSGLGVPIRCTYITFDPLMRFDELIATYRFQGRRDILLRPISDLAQLFDGIRDQEFVALNSTDRPFYEEISYMMVSMECLIGSEYLKMAEEAGLARGLNLLMGRRDAAFRDARIGRMSYFGQCWIDRNFSFDYALKSVEKISAGDGQLAVRTVRGALKKSSYTLLGRMLRLNGATETQLDPHEPIDHESEHFEESGADAELRATHIEVPDGQYLELLDESFDTLRSEVSVTLEAVSGRMRGIDRDIITRELDRWSVRKGWSRINES
jgi:radical SAM superfamily enzyme YgiQ (UPF0313 family)